MKLIVDENLHALTVKILKDNGFEILTIDDILSWGATDGEIFRYATEYQIPIITHDRGFGQLYHLSSKNPPLTIVIRVREPHPDMTNKILIQALTNIDLMNQKYSGKLVIISRNNIRIR